MFEKTARLHDAGEVWLAQPVPVRLTPSGRCDPQRLGDRKPLRSTDEGTRLQRAEDVTSRADKGGAVCKVVEVQERQAAPRRIGRLGLPSAAFAADDRDVHEADVGPHQ